MREKGWAAGETSAGAVQRSCMLLAAAGLLGCSTSDSMPCGYGLQNHFGVASVPNCCEPLGLGCSHAWDVHMRTSICAVMHGMGTCAQASAQSCMGWAHAHKHLRSHTWDGHMGTNICAAIHGMGTWAQTFWRTYMGWAHGHKHSGGGLVRMQCAQAAHAVLLKLCGLRSRPVRSL
jgi:hypothetical protein